jgi:hypothetical protein
MYEKKNQEDDDGFEFDIEDDPELAQIHEDLQSTP